MGEHWTPAEALIHREILRRRGEMLVFTNGHFDLLHVGHLDYLEKARALGDALYVGLNGDASTARLKGVGRPIIPALERARLLAALLPVSAVVIFEEDTAEALIRALQPDIYVKGGDYTLDTLNQEERRAVERAGGKIVIIPFVPGKSTTATLKKIMRL